MGQLQGRSEHYCVEGEGPNRLSGGDGDGDHEHDHGRQLHIGRESMNDAVLVHVESMSVAGTHG
jgi:hypothetical protein